MIRIPPMSEIPYPIAKFRLGRIVLTTRALERLSQDDLLTAIQRHQAGDWGNVTEERRQKNELSLKEGFCLVSVYHASNSERVQIVTEADRSSTTVLMPEEITDIAAFFL
jgi:hypothetical protein